MKYTVSIDDELVNKLADNMSLSGRVNGMNVAAVIRASQVTGNEKSKKRIKQAALVEAYIGRTSGTASGPGDEVEF